MVFNPLVLVVCDQFPLTLFPEFEESTKVHLLYNIPFHLKGKMHGLFTAAPLNKYTDQDCKKKYCHKQNSTLVFAIKKITTHHYKG